MRLTELQNISKDSVRVHLTGGVDVVLPPQQTIKNIDVQEMDSIRGKVKFTENLTEVSQTSGKQLIFG